MEIPFLHGESDHESAEKEKDKVVGVTGSNLFARHDAKKGKQGQR